MFCDSRFLLLKPMQSAADDVASSRVGMTENGSMSRFKQADLVDTGPQPHDSVQKSSQEMLTSCFREP